MHTTSRRLNIGERGSILMETVLCLPLLLLLIGGSMWLGELHLTRFQLSQVEREAAFGPRRELPAPANATVTTDEVGDFYLSTTAIGERVVDMPIWTHGLFSVFETLYSEQNLPRQITVNGREIRRGLTAITRAPEVTEPRTADGGDLAKGKWKELINEPWLDDSTAPPEVNRVPNLEEHRRNRAYERVSL